MLRSLFETGHPWITFKDPCNIRSPQQHRGVIHSSNLCTEIIEYSSPDEIAVCNLASISLKKFLVPKDMSNVRLKIYSKPFKKPTKIAPGFLRSPYDSDDLKTIQKQTF